MHLTGAKFLRNSLKGTEDMVIFVLLYKLIHSFMHANMLIIEYYPLSGIANYFLTVRRYHCYSCIKLQLYIYLSRTLIHMPTTFM